MADEPQDPGVIRFPYKNKPPDLSKIPKKRGPKPKAHPAQPRPEEHLSPAKSRFVIEYMKDLDPTAAYLRAVPECTDPEEARKMGGRFLRSPKVTRVITRVFRETYKDQISPEYAMRALHHVTEVARQEYDLVDKEGNPVGVTRMVDAQSAVAAARTIAQIHGMIGAGPNVTVNNVNVAGAAQADGGMLLTKEELSRMPEELFNALCEFKESNDVGGEETKALPAPTTPPPDDVLEGEFQPRSTTDETE